MSFGVLKIVLVIIVKGIRPLLLPLVSLARIDLNHSRFFLVYTGLAHRDKSLFVVMIVVGSYHILRSRLI